LLDAIVVPKVESAEHLGIISRFLDDCKDKKVKLLAAIESAKAVVDLKEICKGGGSRLDALIVSILCTLC
jgi:citrate lyase beta subunit